MVGGIVYEPGNSTKTKTGTWRSARPVCDQVKCIQCRKCELLCPEACIVVFTTKPTDKKWAVDLDYCKGCGICANVCPVKAIMMASEEK